MVEYTPSSLDPEAQAEADSADLRATHLRRRRLAIRASVAALVFISIGSAGVYAFGSTPDHETLKQKVSFTTAPIERGTLAGTTKSSGTLTFAGAQDIASALGGVVTALPNTGAQIGLGKALFTLDNVPVFSFHGAIPAWRSFETGMKNGPDVKQLEQSLAALGFFKPAPDEKFTSQTEASIRAWQKATGQVTTGTIDLGRIVFTPGDVRIAAVKVAVGVQLGGGSPAVGVTSLDKKVDVDLKLADQQLAVVGGKVTIDLPSGKSTDGTITAVSVPTEKDNGSGKTVVIPVVISLTDPAATGAIQQASVTVNFPSEERKNVLSVPIGALQAFDANRFCVEVVEASGKTKRIAVKTGLFAGGRVEISGAGIVANQKVVVPGL